MDRQTGTSPQTRTPAVLYCDESGNTGSNLNDPNQPFYVLAGLVVPEGEARPLENLIERLRQDAVARSTELKASSLMKCSRGRNALGRFLMDLLDTPVAAFVSVYEKRFGICARIVDDCLDGAYNARVDIRLTGDPLGKQRIANRLYRTLDGQTLRHWADAWRSGDRDRVTAATKQLCIALRKSRKHVLAYKIEGALENTEEWLHRASALESINLPVWVSAFMQVEYFCEWAGLGPVRIVHDEIPQFDAAYQKVLNLFAAGAPHMYIGNQGAPFVSGLQRLTSYRTGSSKRCVLIQAADAVASSTGMFLKRTSTNDSLDPSLELIDGFLRRLTTMSTFVLGVNHANWMVAESTLEHIARLPKAPTTT